LLARMDARMAKRWALISASAISAIDQERALRTRLKLLSSIAIIAYSFHDKLSK
jgi:hypothetical protein